jgi:small conductance mechanosensitive channel
MDIEKMYDTISYWLTTYSMKFIAALVVFIIGKWLAGHVSRLVVRLLEKNKIEPTLIHFLENVVYYTLLVVVFVAAAGQLGINTASFLTIIGAAGLAIGLALKDSLANIASGVMIIFLRPFKLGDLVTTVGVTGRVAAINIFHTTINSLDNKKVIIPNSSITSDVITNINDNPTRRVDMIFGISYDDDIGKAKGILNDIIASDPRVLKDPAPTIALSELADSSVNFIVRPWVNTDDYWNVFFEVTEKVKRTFDEQDITIPYPQRDVHLYQEKE